MGTPETQFPTVFNTFERTIEGKLRKFWVQDLKSDKMEEALEIFSKYFVRDEPLCRSLKLIEDKKSMKFAMEFWRKVAEKRCSLACFTKLETGEQKLVALNFCYECSVNDPPKESDSESGLAGKIVEAVNYVYGLKDPQKELGVEKYLAAIGLVTIPEYRGYNIGLEVLRAREQMCAVLGLKASLTVFTSEAAQRLAEKAGFKDLVGMTYNELEKLNPDLKFPNINEYSRYVRNMYIIYE
ncbi:uncharacterized protein LOC123310792 [Coccinella septempunctata]|uniref:uncharacterized protein LOC123310792 n=1 Tax=Coccinella septempunctata TaxID=41139 RepID=UPI001D0953CF|nr:uncharacterized protein LOC123310792 [Coccinella septempunctata]